MPGVVPIPDRWRNYSMPSRPLIAEEREEIRAGLVAGEQVKEIGERLGRHRCTIWREIRRNGGPGRYCAVEAQRRADGQRSRPKVPKLVADPELAGEVTRRLEAKDSPMRVSIELGREGRPVSHETIYQAIYRRDRGLPEDVHRCLHLRRRRRRRRGQRSPGSHSLGIYCRIHDRPQIAADRGQVGHLEGDLIVGAYNRSALITIFDRMSRYLWLQAVAAKSADAVEEALWDVFTHRIPPGAARTLAWDQGAEIASHRELALACDIEIYIADPKSPWQRPTNEAGNALVRRYVGKGTDLNRLTTSDLEWIEHRINTIPRRIFGWDTAHDTYTAAVAMTD